MKHVLIIDDSPIFREYLRAKLEENNIEASIAISAMDGITKMRSTAPDLIIMDYHLSGRQSFTEVLRQKKADVNTANTPVIMMARRIDQKRLIELVPYNVKKVFNKPIKIDTFFATISELLGIPFSVDESPGIVEVHVNDSIIFIEIAKGLNRDKINLLRFKIIELIGLYEIRVPKVIIMLSDIKLGFGDAPNMQMLLNTVIQASKARLRYIRILTNDDFIRRFISGQKEYTDIEVVSNLQFAVDDLLSEIGKNPDAIGRKAEIIGDKVLQATHREDGEAMVLKFDAEAKNASYEIMVDSIQNLRIAVIDDDFITQELIKNTFRKTGAIVSTFSDGEEFLAVIDTAEYDLAFLDLNMPKVDGFAVLRAMQSRDIRYPVIVLSAIVQRETMIRAIQMGVKSYLVKPLKPEDIFKKSIEILKANF